MLLYLLNYILVMLGTMLRYARDFLYYNIFIIGKARIGVMKYISDMTGAIRILASFHDMQCLLSTLLEWSSNDIGGNLHISNLLLDLLKCINNNRERIYRLLCIHWQVDNSAELTRRFAHGYHMRVHNAS